MSVSTRRRYTEEFKREAVRLMRESFYPVAQVARDLGIPENVLYRWRVQHQQVETHGTTHATQCIEAEELTRVKRDLRGCPRNGIFQNVRRRPSRGSSNEIPRDPEHDRQFLTESVREAANRAFVVRLMHGEGIRAKTVKKWRATTYASPATCRDGGTVGTMSAERVSLVS